VAHLLPQRALHPHDFFHLRARAPIPIWYDTGMLLVFAWTGLFLGIFSLRAMQTLVKNFVGWIASWLFVASSLGLGGLGIYKGTGHRIFLQKGDDASIHLWYN
jgi:hypothetical protein